MGRLDHRPQAINLSPCALLAGKAFEPLSVVSLQVLAHLVQGLCAPSRRPKQL